VQGFQEMSERGCRPKPLLIVQSGNAGCAAREKSVPGKRPRIIGRWPTQVFWPWDCQGDSCPEMRQDAAFVIEELQRELPPGKAEDVTFVDEPGGIVPAGAEQLKSGRHQVGELRLEERARQRLGNHTFGCPC